ncbi:MAG: hypothetical protein P1V97_07380 [Planctomycetota bacterium]|nr:hypothetical protein [Planctomycetota bacterium]
MERTMAEAMMARVEEAYKTQYQAGYAEGFAAGLLEGHWRAVQNMKTLILSRMRPLFEDRSEAEINQAFEALADLVRQGQNVVTLFNIDSWDAYWREPKSD